MERRADEVMHTMQIYDYRNRQPSQLSGGQQQRVALARAIVIQPRVLLMDEPLSNLDAKLRVEMRNSIRHLQKSLGITTIYVTHDQEEALAISDRIAVMHDGVIEQLGDPIEIYSRPVNRFVANFIGTTNFVPAEVYPDGLQVDGEAYRGVRCKNAGNRPMVLAFRPEHARISKIKCENAISGTVSISTFLGDYISYEVELKNGQIVFVNEYAEHMEEIFRTGDAVNIVLPPKRVMLFDAETGDAIPLEIAGQNP